MNNNYIWDTQLYLNNVLCEEDACVIPPPPPSTPRPTPTLPPEIKVVVMAGQKSASTLLICFVATTLFLFGWMKVYNNSRLIQMNMEIALILAHVLAVILPNLSEYSQVCFYFKYKDLCVRNYCPSQLYYIT